MTDRNDPQRKRLETIRELMESHYIDEEEAKSIMNRARIIEEGPYKIAEGIDDAIRPGIGIISYSPTAERISGLTEIVEAAANYSNEFQPSYDSLVYNPNNNPVVYLPEEFPDLGLFKLEFDCIRPDERETIEILSPYFHVANQVEIISDNDFRNLVVLNIVKSYSGIRTQIPKANLELCDRFVKRDLGYMLLQDWDKELSLDEFKKRQAEQIRNHVSGGINSLNVYQKMSRNKVLDNPEHQRQFLCSWLISTGVKSYGEAVEAVEGYIEMRKERLKKNIKLSGATHPIVKNARDMLALSEYAKRLLIGKEKFVEGFLNG
jgi:hypothetical protein